MDWKGSKRKWETSQRLQSHKLEIMVTGIRVGRRGLLGYKEQGERWHQGWYLGFLVPDWGAGEEN